MKLGWRMSLCSEEDPGCFLIIALTLACADRMCQVMDAKVKVTLMFKCYAQLPFTHDSQRLSKVGQLENKGPQQPGKK